VIAPGLDHPALLYRGDDEYLAGTTAFIRTARTAGDPVLVAVPGGNLKLLREALADDTDGITFADMAEAGRNPGRIIPAVLMQFAVDHPDRRVSIVGEPMWPGRTELEYPACVAHEALINAAFRDRDAAILCPYDVDGLDAATVTDAWHTHPVMIDQGARVPSDRYDDPLRTAARCNRPLPPPPAGAERMTYYIGPDLAGVRRFVRRQCAGTLSAARTADLTLAAHELAANTVRHTVGPGRITLWTEPGLMVCQVDDTGHLADPMAGRLLPSVLRPCGRGLLLVNQICDLVRVHTGPAGTSIRIQLSIPER
jgi:anti-sigma regulatory factor (Ser/Thr protein kinase)